LVKGPSNPSSYGLSGGIMVQPGNGNSGLTLTSGSATDNTYINFSKGTASNGEQFAFAIGRDGTNDRGLIKHTDNDVAYVTANGIAFPSGKGIDFSATANAAGMTSELLDDYEEGTWSSTISGPIALSAYNFISGYYTKIGRLVHITGEITYTPTASGTELGMVIYAPFAMVEDGGVAPGAGAVYWSHVRGPGLIIDNTSSNSTDLYLILQSVNNTSSSSGTLRFGLTYHTT